MTARHRLGDLPDLGPAAIAIGVFDGVHHGHQSLVLAVEGAARQVGARGVMIVIDPHPDEVFGSSGSVTRLTSVSRTAELLESYATVGVVVVEFDRGVAALAPDEFLAALSPGLDVRAVVMTDESRFGRARSGTPERVREIGDDRGFELVLAPLVEVDGVRVSSTRVREAVQRGDLPLAGALMGRPHAVDGVVRERSARDLELVPPYAATLPPPGEYRGTITPDNRAGIGPEPTRVSVDAGRILVDRAAPAAGEQVRVTFA